MSSSRITRHTDYSPTQRQGFNYEDQAIAYLEKNGLICLKRNLACHYGEIDCVMRENHLLVFVEIRYRSNLSYGGALGSITRVKQQKIRHTAQYFLPYLTREFFQGKAPYCRFDVVAFDGDTIHWVRQAFT